MKKNWYNNELVVRSALLPVNRTADVNGISIDTQGFSSAILVAHIGLSGDTLSGSVKAELELEHCDDNATWVDCANADLQNPDTGAAGHVTGTNTGTFALIDDPAEDELLYAVRYVGSKRYVRMVYNITGTHTVGTPVSAKAYLSGHPIV